MDKEQETSTPEEPGNSPPEREIQPWRDMLWRPRLTARYLVANESTRSAITMWLALTALLIALLFVSVMLSGSSPDPAAARMRLVLYTVPIFLFSIGFFLLESQLLWAVLNFFGGKADISGVRIVYSFTNVIPGVIFLLVDLALSFVMPRDSAIFRLIGNFIMCWSFYITIAGLAEISRISLWRSAITLLLSLLVWVTAFVGLAKVLGLEIPGA